MREQHRRSFANGFGGQCLTLRTFEASLLHGRV
jgi:hypothetical protein